mmetsp:Transcript_20798/g.48633  ORF Transcript_20798/g.48633 Transcript_20798/m.48633 type:complete len:263 (+) Transcript_20798:52-840(+)
MAGPPVPLAFALSGFLDSRLNGIYEKNSACKTIGLYDTFWKHDSEDEMFMYFQAAEGRYAITMRLCPITNLDMLHAVNRGEVPGLAYYRPIHTPPRDKDENTWREYLIGEDDWFLHPRTEPPAITYTPIYSREILDWELSRQQQLRASQPAGPKLTTPLPIASTPAPLKRGTIPGTPPQSKVQRSSMSSLPSSEAPAPRTPPYPPPKSPPGSPNQDATSAERCETQGESDPQHRRRLPLPSRKRKEAPEGSRFPKPTCKRPE